MLTPGKEWKMLADLRKQLAFPIEIVTTTIRPDIVMWSTVQKRVLLIGLTIPWNGRVKPAESYKGAGRGGRESKLLAVAPEKA
ncbi:hypothetical protein Baya_3855 [Bagarius yarrelli]|uniref:Uncharacterized protein n=1 Tax=Bagarius yarrelli TaxID=175774 RepID=A0A556TWR9_BAGYA|nr:hypothetical protein Baya_3855 [Bagarius yarrelli]